MSSTRQPGCAVVGVTGLAVNVVLELRWELQVQLVDDKGVDIVEVPVRAHNDELAVWR